ncbi:MAG: hypothetical protein KDE27_02535 [Planctomycetes bacterium]|nr:hypothetical protein [Planctomycetota bacterium]
MRQLLAPLVLIACAAAQDNAVLTRLRAAAEQAPLVVAHRGASSTHPENTLAAMRAAVDAGADLVEFDVYQTADGAWVCIHDQTVDRTTDAVKRLGRQRIKVDELTLAEIRALDAGSWFGAGFADERVPTLAEALAAILPAAVPMIERKGGDAGALAAELARLERLDEVMVQAFDWDFLTELHRVEPRLLIGALGAKELSPARHEELSRTGAAIVHWNHGDLTVEAAAAVRAADRLLCVYTVDPDPCLLGAAAIGCHLVTTNRPARMAELRRRGLLQSRPRTR